MVQISIWTTDLLAGNKVNLPNTNEDDLFLTGMLRLLKEADERKEDKETFQSYFNSICKQHTVHLKTSGRLDVGSNHSFHQPTKESYQYLDTYIFTSNIDSQSFEIRSPLQSYHSSPYTFNEQQEFNNYTTYNYQLTEGEVKNLFYNLFEAVGFLVIEDLSNLEVRLWSEQTDLLKDCFTIEEFEKLIHLHLIENE